MEIILSIAATLIMLLLGIIGYFLNKLIGRLDTLTERLDDVSDKLNDAITKAMVQHETIINIKEKSEDIIARLTSHSSRLGKVERDIATIETKCNILHSK